MALKESIPFSWKLYKTGNYDAYTRDGSVKMIRVFLTTGSPDFDDDNTEIMYPFNAIFDSVMNGNYGSASYACYGHYYHSDMTKKIHKDLDLVLVPKEIYEMEPYIKPISRIPFQYDLYLSGNYTPITKNGSVVVIVNVDLTEIYPISGYVQGGKPGFKPTDGDTWTIEGHLFRKTIEDGELIPSLEETRKALGDTYDLMLIPKPDSFIEVPTVTPVVEKPALVEYKLSSETREKYYVISIKKMDNGEVEPFMSGHYHVLADALNYVSRTSRECVIVNSVDIPGLREMMIEKGYLIPK